LSLVQYQDGAISQFRFSLFLNLATETFSNNDLADKYTDNNRQNRLFRYNKLMTTLILF